jgi:hypothetical protein
MNEPQTSSPNPDAAPLAETSLAMKTLLIKLRWIGMEEEEARRVQSRLCRGRSAAGALAAGPETD